MKKQTIAKILVIALSAALTMGCGTQSGEDSSVESSSSVSSGSSAVSESSAASSSETDAEENSAAEVEETQYPLTITDDLGNDVTIESEPERVVSLSPANTETLFAIEADEKIVGRTDYCSYPEEAAEVESVGSYSSPNAELIISLEPDVIFVSDYIDDSVRSQVEDAGAVVIVFAANDIESVQQNILTAGQVLNLNAQAAEVVDEMEAELAELQEILSANTEEKSAFIDLGDYYSAGEGSLLGNMLDDIGVLNVAADSGEMWPQLSVETIIESNPDVYISLYTTPEELKAVSGLSELDCIQNDSIIYIESLSEESDLIQRPGPRLVEGTRLLAEMIYPELFS